MSRQIDTQQGVRDGPTTFRRRRNWWTAARVVAVGALLAFGPGISPAAASGGASRTGTDAVSVWASAPAPGHPFGIAVDDDRV